MSQNVNLDAFEDNLNVSWGKVIGRRNNFKFTCPKDWWQTDNGDPIDFYLGQSPGWTIGLMKKFDPEIDVVFFSATWIVIHAYDSMGEPFFYDNKIPGTNQDIPIPERLEEIEKWLYKLSEKSDAEVLIGMVGDMIKEYNKNNTDITPEMVKTPSKPETQS